MIKEHVESLVSAIIIRALRDARDNKLSSRVRAEAQNWLETTGLQWSEELCISEEAWQRLMQSTQEENHQTYQTYQTYKSYIF